jgi:hypothetical protein
MSLLKSKRALLSVCFIAGLACASFWANSRDPFKRIRFTLKRPQTSAVEGWAVLPKAGGPFPVIICLHDSSEGSTASKQRLRQFAELGFAAVDFQFNQTSQPYFNRQFSSLLQYLAAQKWAAPNLITWFGCGNSNARLLGFVAEHPHIRPHLLVGLSNGSWLQHLPPSTSDAIDPVAGSPGAPTADRPDTAQSQAPDCRYLFVQGAAPSPSGDDGIKRLVAYLGIGSAAVDFSVLRAPGPDFDESPAVVYRSIAEYVAAHSGLAGGRIHPPEIPVWRFWWPLFLIAAWPASRAWRTLRASTYLPDFWAHRGFTAVALAVALWASLETAFYLGLHRFPVSPRVNSLARRALVAKTSTSDFDFLVRDPGWQTKPLRLMLEHIQLAALQQRQFYSNLDNSMFQEFVLSPRLTPDAPLEWDWRRTLWEACYPRVRKESNPLVAARVIARFLRERVGIDPAARTNAGIQTSWRLGLADREGFEHLYAAALRSVGIAARINTADRAEYWNGQAWSQAPPPLVEAKLPIATYHFP